MESTTSSFSSPLSPRWDTCGSRLQVLERCNQLICTMQHGWRDTYSCGHIGLLLTHDRFSADIQYNKYYSVCGESTCYSLAFQFIISWHPSSHPSTCINPTSNLLGVAAPAAPARQLHHNDCVTGLRSKVARSFHEIVEWRAATRKGREAREARVTTPHTGAAVEQASETTPERGSIRRAHEIHRRAVRVRALRHGSARGRGFATEA